MLSDIKSGRLTLRSQAKPLSRDRANHFDIKWIFGVRKICRSFLLHWDSIFGRQISKKSLFYEMVSELFRVFNLTAERDPCSGDDLQLSPSNRFEPRVFRVDE